MSTYSIKAYFTSFFSEMKANGEDKIDTMYRVGDYVYFEHSGFGLYAIRRIEELTKTQNGKF